MAIITLIEILILFIGGTLYHFRTGEKISEAIAKGLFCSILLLSFSFQIAFLLGNSKISFLLEVPMVGLSLFYIKNNIDKLQKLAQGIKIFFGNYKISLSILSILWIYLFCLAVLSPPSNWDSMTYNLARILLFQQEQSLFLTNYSSESQAIFPVGNDILHHSFLRFYSDYGIGIFSFIAYLIICFGTYALGRRYAKPQHALIATLVIASLPGLVLQSTTTKNDIGTATVAVICFILINRILTKINVEDLVLLPITLAFGVSVKTTFMAFGAPFMFVFSILLLKKYNWKYLLQIVKEYKLYFILSILPILIFFPFFNFYHNYHLLGTWQGSEGFSNFHKQIDGFRGTSGNIVRYLLQTIDFLAPVEETFKVITGKIFNQQGFTITDVLVDFYNQYLYPIFENKGIMKSSYFPIMSNNNGLLFFIIRYNDNDHSWYGPFAFFLIIPSLIFALIKGDLYLKAVSFNLIFYFVFLCNQIAWQPWANRFFSLFFASSGITIAYLLSQLKINKFIANILISLSLMILTYTISFNSNQPLLASLDEKINLSQLNPINWQKNIREKSIWSLTKFGKNRTFYGDYRDYPPANIISQFVPTNSTVALVGTHDSWIYFYLLYNPKINIIPFNSENPSVWEKINKSEKIDHVFCLEVSCDHFTKENGTEVLWNSTEGKKGILFKLPKS